MSIIVKIKTRIEIRQNYFLNTGINPRLAVILTLPHTLYKTCCSCYLHFGKIKLCKVTCSKLSSSEYNTHVQQYTFQFVTWSMDCNEARLSPGGSRKPAWPMWPDSDAASFSPFRLRRFMKTVMLTSGSLNAGSKPSSDYRPGITGCACADMSASKTPS